MATSTSPRPAPRPLGVGWEERTRASAPARSKGRGGVSKAKGAKEGRPGGLVRAAGVSRAEDLGGAV